MEFSGFQVFAMQDNVALIAVLEALDPPLQEGNVNPRRQLICVANTHIHANPELNDVKLWQVQDQPPLWPFPLSSRCARLMACVMQACCTCGTLHNKERPYLEKKEDRDNHQL